MSLPVPQVSVVRIELNLPNSLYESIQDHGKGMKSHIHRSNIERLKGGGEERRGEERREIHKLIEVIQSHWYLMRSLWCNKTSQSKLLRAIILL